MSKPQNPKAHATEPFLQSTAGYATTARVTDTGCQGRSAAGLPHVKGAPGPQRPHYAVGGCFELACNLSAHIHSQDAIVAVVATGAIATSRYVPDIVY